jgi:hypothetical protein
MADLSPAAKAVLDAAFTLADNLDRDVTETEMIAAALRAAANQLGKELEFYNEVVISAEDLLAIAAELEGQ